MGITDGIKAATSGKSKNPANPKPPVTVETNGGGEGSIPHMVITSVEGVEEEIAMGDLNGSEKEAKAVNVESKDEVPVDASEVAVQEVVPSSSTKEESAVNQPDVAEDPGSQDKSKSAVQRPLIINGTDDPKSDVQETEKIDSTKTVQSAIQRPLVFDGTDEPKSDVQETEKTDGAKAVQSAIQRPLVFDGVPEEPKRDLQSEPSFESDSSKVPLQSASQRPLIVDSETAKKQPESTTAVQEGIYEVIEPKDKDLNQGNVEDSESENKETPAISASAGCPKENEGFFSRSRAFWKHEAKPIFNFPKFNFGSKEARSSKKRAHSDSRKEKEKEEGEEKQQEYCLESAENVQDTGAGTYRRIDEDAGLSKSQEKKVDEDVKLPRPAEGNAVQQGDVLPEKKGSAIKTTDRSNMIHPVSVSTQQPKLENISKVEEENFEIVQARQPEKQPGERKPETEKRESTPESLYDTCCLKLAYLVRTKALELSEGAKAGAPKKPPKPSAEAVAKARAALASKKMKDPEKRPRTFGDNIPVGYDGIQYADDDTESSTDYKDVENLAILNPECYGIIRKMKSDGKDDSFRASSTCSGISSYYTADTATLKDENSSDNTLETVSLGSCDSIVCRPPIESKDISGKVETVSSEPSKKSAKQRSTTESKLPTPAKKKVPPPIPPKPAVLLKSQESIVVNQMPSFPKSDEKDISRCVNSLSLSPRPILRSTGSSASIRKRPLTIAGGQETRHIQVNRDKILEGVKKPLVKSSSTRTMRNLPLEPFSLAKSLSFSSRPTVSKPKPVSKPQPPPRPPPPSLTSSSQRISGVVPGSKDAEVVSSSVPDVPAPAQHKALPKPKVPPPPVSTAKPSLPASVPSPAKPPPPTPIPSPPKPPPSASVPSPPKPPPPASVPSPPKPPPPVVSPAKSPPPVLPKPSPPPRPPPPASRTVSPPRKRGKPEREVPKSEESLVQPTVEIPQSVEPSVLPGEEKLAGETVQYKPVVEGAAIPDAIHVPVIEVQETKDAEGTAVAIAVSNSLQEEDASVGKQGSITEVPADFEHSDARQFDEKEAYVTAVPPRLPRPPPRVRRIRSRTVEIVPLTEKPPERSRRSQSLSDADIKKRIESSSITTPDNPELKMLYTAVQKDPTKARASSADSTKNAVRDSPNLEASGRPLPAPPPPPRSKSRSSSRRSKSDERPSPSAEAKSDVCSIAKSESMPNAINSAQIKPPARKKKDSKRRFFSLGGRKHDDDNSKYKPTFYSLKLEKESSEPPVKPERKTKHNQPIHFDENANVADPSGGVPVDVPKRDSPLSRARGHSVGSGSDRMEQKEKVPKLQRSVSETPKKKQHSSWYDETDSQGKVDTGTKPEDGLSGSWEKLDWQLDSTASSWPKQTPPRKKKPRQSSTFYVDVKNEVTKENEGGYAAAEEAPIVSPVPTVSPVPSISPAPTPMEDKETSPLPLDCSEKSVQTSLETLSIASRGEASDDTDVLLDLAQTLQNELKTIITRHNKYVTKSDEESSSISEPSLGASTSRKPGMLSVKPQKLPHSSTSSSSELWQISSSDESDDEIANRQEVNLSELSRIKKQKKIFYAAREIMTSEESFVDALKLLNVDFRSYVNEVSKQRGSAVLPPEVLNQILNHLPQLQNLNENLLMELKDRIENWDSFNKIADVIVKMGPFLKLYSWYIQDFESTVSLLEESKKKYPAFAQCVKEFELSPKCKKLTLNHYMLKPVQRIPQYRLLLQEYLHHLPADSVDFEDTTEALRIVSDVANHANESMRQGDNFQKLMSIQNSILGHKEIIKPGRMFIKEGELMKLSRKGMQPRWFVLMNDLLLYLTPVQQGLFRINHELPLAGMKVAIPIQEDYQNEFSVISVTRSFTLAAKSPEERQEWIIALTKAIEENASKRSTFTNVRLQQKSQESAEASAATADDEGFVLGKKAPVWIPDARVTMCQLCTSEFTVTFRRHHCRACGKVICSICSSNRISLQYLGHRIARVCDECHAKLGQVSSGCTESGETDSDNQQIALKPHMRTDHWHQKKGKRNLPSVLKEVCANDKGSTISGYMHKRVNKNWKRNWFVVKDKVLYEYKASEDVAALRSIPLLGFQINTFTEPFEGIDSSLLFEISHPGQPPILFHADTPGSAERWIKELRDATVLE